MSINKIITLILFSSYCHVCLKEANIPNFQVMQSWQYNLQISLF
jgi:hypothetical protein